MNETNLNNPVSDSPERLHPFYVKNFDRDMSTMQGEFDFYCQAARAAADRGESVLDIGCGTGRVSIEMANAGANVVGMDLSPSIVEVAYEKTKHRQDLRFVQGDMEDFDLGQRFGLIVMTGYAFHYAKTPEAQLSCLASVARHLHPNGVLIIHLNRPSATWLAELRSKHGTWSEHFPPNFDPDTGLEVSMVWGCKYEPNSETLSSTLSWNFCDKDGKLIEQRIAEPIISHSYNRFEVEHLLRRSGFSPDHIYGDFVGTEHSDDSAIMVWVARLKKA